MPPWQPLEAGDPDECGGFRLTHRLGQGGFGTVYLGFRPDFSYPAAVKIFKTHHASEATWRGRFLLEIELIKTMNGVHTAPLLDSGGHDEPPWLATRYVQAPSLGKLVEQYGAFDPMCGWWLAAGLAEALMEIHSKGILHRDLKPQNVLVARSGVLIIDFGISRLADGSGLTTNPQFIGTAPYAPMEQIVNFSDVTEKSDVFALGAVLTWTMTGRTPYDGMPWPARAAGAEPDLSAVPLELREMVKQCVSDDPQLRPTPAGILSTAISHLADYAIPLAAGDAGLPLPAEIRDFVDMWADAPVPLPDLVTTGSGTSGVATEPSGPVSGPVAPDSGSGGSPAQPRRSFGTNWQEQWREGVERRRDQYGE